MTSTQNDGEKASASSPRNFPNWLQAYYEWAEPSTDAPISFIGWGALFAIASVAKRKVKLPRAIVGSYDIYPHLFIMFVGPPGSRKTASINNFARRLLESVPNINFNSTFFTKETLTTDLSSYSDSSVSLVVGEFGELMQKNKPQEMYDFLISLFDGSSEKEIKVSTFKRGNEIAVAPCVNMVAATTRSWIAENMSENAIGGGYSSRVIYVHEQGLRDNGLLIYRKRLRNIGVDVQKYENDLLTDLIRISQLEGNFDMTEEVEDYINDWYQGHHRIASQAPEKMHGYFSRKPLMVMKLAMLHSLATKDELWITKEDFDFGVNLMTSTEQTLSTVFSGVGKNEYTLNLQEILAYISQRDNGATLADIQRQFLSVGNEDIIRKLLKTGVIADYIEFREEWDTETTSMVGRFFTRQVL